MAEPLKKMLPSLPDVERGSSVPEGPWGWSFEALGGRLTELSGGPATSVLTTAFRMVWQAQEAGEPVVWVTDCASSFFPPDVAHNGVDLEALVVVRVPGDHLAPRAADYLLRSGAFGLVVLDLGPGSRMSLPAQARLGGLAKKHHAAVLLLTQKTDDQHSLGSLVSLRAEAIRKERRNGAYPCRVTILKNKRGGTGRSPGGEELEDMYRAPDGVC